MKHIVLTSMPDELSAAQWNAFVADAVFATHYVTPNYFIDPCVKGDRFAILAVDDKGKIGAVATGVFDGNTLACGLSSRPQIVFRNGIDRIEAAAALING